MNHLWIIVSGLLIHLIFLSSIFDIYFTSPIIHGATPVKSSLKAPADRVVLFVADGLRASKIINKTDLGNPIISDKVKFLKNIIENNGSWGISYTHLPTESRPGHVALLAGFYEDPSAVTKGWQENPVNFDSVLNQSKNVFCWGSPDILNIFTKVGTHINKRSYSSEKIDFATTSTIWLDNWVFDEVDNFFHIFNQTERMPILMKEGTIFFLHLLGIDTAGHAFKPHSKEYEENIQAVDVGIRKTVEIIENFYNYDGKTAYVFTSDHGMTDWGSHGAGDDSETETPLIVWGAGIKHITNRRLDVQQADIAPLLATLIGIPIPVNSIGDLPGDYLDMTEEQLAYAYFANTKQISSQFVLKRSQIKNNLIRYFYKEFPQLSYDNYVMYLKRIKELLKEREYNQVIHLGNRLTMLCKKGLQYYHEYYKRPLLTAISLSYILWTVILFGYIHSDIVVDSNMELTKLWKIKMNIFIILILLMVAVWYLLKSQNFQLMYYIYFLLPVLLSIVINKNLEWYSSIIKHALLMFSWTKVLGITVITVALELLVLTFFYRYSLSLIAVILSVWPYFKSHLYKSYRKYSITWATTCIFLAVFPFLPVIGSNKNFILIVIGCILWLLTNTYKLLYAVIQKNVVAKVLFLQLILVLFASMRAIAVHFNLFPSIDTGLIGYIFTWILTAAAMVLPLAGNINVMSRLYSMSFGFYVPFMMLSITYEPIFLFLFVINLSSWINLEFYDKRNDTDLTLIEFSDENTIERPVTEEDYQCAFFCLFYCILSLFGTGNVASINSFDPTIVMCYVTVFSPFLMMTLLLLKLLLPFIITCSFFRGVNISTGKPAHKLILILMTYSNFLGIHFLFFVTNVGSWLDIGTSISHFVIVQGSTFFIVLILTIAKIFTDISIWDFVNNKNVQYPLPMTELKRD